MGCEHCEREEEARLQRVADEGGKIHCDLSAAPTRDEVSEGVGRLMGPNEREMVRLRERALPDIFSLDNDEAAMLLLRRGRTKEATLWVSRVIEAVKQDPMRLYGLDDETIAATILERINDR